MAWWKRAHRVLHMMICKDMLVCLGAKPTFSKKKKKKSTINLGDLITGNQELKVSVQNRHNYIKETEEIIHQKK